MVIEIRIPISKEFGNGKARVEGDKFEIGDTGNFLVWKNNKIVAMFRDWIQFRIVKDN